MPHFHETVHGEKFFRSQLPRLIEALETLGKNVGILNEKLTKEEIPSKGDSKRET